MGTSPLLQAVTIVHPGGVRPVPSSDSCSDLMEALAGENLFLRKQLALYIE
jgi:hypothetical protein